MFRQLGCQDQSKQCCTSIRLEVEKKPALDYQLDLANKFEAKPKRYYVAEQRNPTICL